MFPLGRVKIGVLALAACGSGSSSSAASAAPSWAATLGKPSTVQLPSITDFALGYTAIDGHKALVGLTGKYCMPGNTPKCTSISNPAAIFATRKSFSALWSNAINATVPYLTPCIEIGGKWYVYVPS